MSPDGDSTRIKIGDFRRLLARDSRAASELWLRLAHSAAVKLVRHYGLPVDAVDDIASSTLVLLCDRMSSLNAAMPRPRWPHGSKGFRAASRAWKFAD